MESGSPPRGGAPMTGDWWREEKVGQGGAVHLLCPSFVPLRRLHSCGLLSDRSSACLSPGATKIEHQPETNRGQRCADDFHLEDQLVGYLAGRDRGNDDADKRDR